MADYDLLGDEGRKWVTACVKVTIVGQPKLSTPPPGYTRSEAVERLRGCYVELPNGKDMKSLYNYFDEDEKTYNILDIHRALTDLDKECDDADGRQKDLLQLLGRRSVDIEAVEGISDNSDEYPKSFEGLGPVRHPTEQTDFRCLKQEIDRFRSDIEKEYQQYKEACSRDEIDHGSGFIISDHFVITCKHVVQDALDDPKKKIHISNETIDELRCEVTVADPASDLALLYCKDLNIEQSGISPLPLSTKSPLQGMSISVFGYPFTCVEKGALVVSGIVSKDRLERYGRPSFIVLNCSVSPGNSGGPVFRRINGQLKVVAVLAQKHKKDITTIEEKNIVEATRVSLETSSIVDFKDHGMRPDTGQTAKLTVKLCDAVEDTHCQFGLCNAVPGSLVVDFLKKCKEELDQGKEELDQVVKNSEDHVNVLPSGHHRSSDCMLC